MSTIRRVFRHTAIQFAARAIGTLLGLAAIGIMTRELGTAGFGAYTAVVAYLGVFAVLIDFGISTTLVAMLAEKDAAEEKLQSNALGLRLSSAALLLVSSAAAALFLTNYPPEVKKGIILLTLSYLAVAAQQIQLAVFQRHLRMDRPALSEVFGRLLLVGGVSLAAWKNLGLYGMLWAVIIANVGHALLSHWLLRGIATVRPKFDFAVWLQIARRAWPIGVSIIFNLVYLRADMLILSLSHPLSEVGLYGAAYRVVDVFTVFPMLFMGIVLPFLSAAWSHGDRKKFQRVLQRALDALSLAAAPLVAGALLFAPDLLALVAGEEFRRSGEILRILIVGVAAIFVAAAMSHAVVALRAQRRMLAFLAADAAASLALYLWLIPRYGYWAAAWITVLSEVLAMIAAVYVALKVSRVAISPQILFRAAAAATITAVTLAPFGYSALIPRILAAGMIYLLLALALKAVTVQNIKELAALRSGEAEK